jgi:hypothetical protein
MKNKSEYADFKHTALLLCVNNNVRENASDNEVYEGTRFSWRVRLDRVEKAEIVVAVIRGVIKEVFVASEWLSVTTKNFPGHRAEPDLYGFNGAKAPEKIRCLYVGKRLSKKNRLYGPIGYVGC